jgi:hypothetical protein
VRQKDQYSVEVPTTTLSNSLTNWNLDFFIKIVEQVMLALVCGGLLEVIIHGSIKLLSKY